MRYIPKSWQSPNIKHIVVEKDEHHIKTYIEEPKDTHHDRFGEYDYELDTESSEDS